MRAQFGFVLPPSLLAAGLSLVGACAGRGANTAGAPVARCSAALVPTPTDTLLRLYDDSEVTTPAVPVPDSGSVHPPDPTLRVVGLPQRAVVRFIVDTLGHAEPCSLELLETTNPVWGDAALRQARRIRFYPARRGTRAVRQVVTMPFELRFGP